MHYFYILLCVIEAIVGIALIFIVTIQESKNDGLQGQIGTTASTSFKGKAGREEMLTLATRNIAVVFFVLAFIVAAGAKWK